MPCLILLSFGLTVYYVTTSPFRPPPPHPALYHHCHQRLCRKPRHVHSQLAHSLPGRTSQAARRSSTSGAPCGIRIFLLASNALGCQGCPYPKLGQLKRSDTSNKALARSPKFDCLPTLPQICGEGSLEEAITDALVAASPDEYDSLSARTLFSGFSQESDSEVLDGSRDDAQLPALQPDRPLPTAEVEHPNIYPQVRLI